MNETAQAAGAPAQSEQLDFAESSEAELFEWMAMAASSAVDAQAAFTEFYRRHAGFLYRQCERLYPDAAEDIVADTLCRVYKNAGTFNLNRVREPVTPDMARRRVRSWLCRIAHNVASDFFTAQENEPQTVTPESITILPDVTCADPAKDSPTPNTELIDRVRQVVNELPEQQREIAWVIAHRWSPDYEQNQWSSEDLKVIAEKFDLTPENLRQIRSRLIKKLRTILTPVLGGGGSAR